MSLKPLPPIKELVSDVKREARRVGVSQEELGKAVGLSQPRIANKLNNPEDMETWTYLQIQNLMKPIISKGSLIRERDIRKNANFPVEGLYSDETVKAVANFMKEKSYSQIAIFDRETDRVLGVVTEYDIIYKLLYPTKTRHKKGDRYRDRKTKNVAYTQEEFMNLTVEEAEIRNDIIEVPIDRPTAEIAQLLLTYYAIFLKENTKIVGIVTRADFLNMDNESYSSINK